MKKNINEIINGTSDLADYFQDIEMPKTLYRYRSFNQFWKNNLFDGDVYLAPASTFNDLYDCYPIFDYDILFQNLYEESKHKIKEWFKDISDTEINMKELIKTDNNANALLTVLYLSPEEVLSKIEPMWPDIRKNSNVVKNYLKKEGERLSKITQETARIACFSEINNSHLMWAHYANSHSGFCIKYNLEKFDFSAENKNICAGFMPVIYLEDRYHISPSTNHRLSQYAWFLCLLKSDIWSYEKEWRIISQTGKMVNPVINFSKAIDSIYLGINSRKNHDDCVNEIFSWAKQNEISVFIEIASDVDFSISFQELKL